MKPCALAALSPCISPVISVTCGNGPNPCSPARFGAPVGFVGSNPSPRYYQLIREHQEVREGLPTATATALIPLKARAWLDLNERQKQGGKVEDRDILKHRNDVFRIAATLPGEAGPVLPYSIKADLRSFLAQFEPHAGAWPAIVASLKETFGTLQPTVLREAVQLYFGLV